MKTYVYWYGGSKPTIGPAFDAALIAGRLRAVAVEMDVVGMICEFSIC